MTSLLLTLLLAQSPLYIRDEGTYVGRALDGIDCVGGAVTCSQSGARLRIAVDGGAAVGGGAPAGAKYITQEPHADLSAEQALSALGTALLQNTTGTGVLSAYTGSACGAGAVARSTSAVGALTCSAVTSADISGAVATASALASNPSDCAANQFANTIAASGNLTCAAIADADVPDTITISLAATATALASNPGDCGANTFAQSIAASGALTCAAVNLASADVTGTLAAGNGGLGMTTVTDDTVAVANGSAWQSKAIPDCDTAGTSKLLYDTGTNAFSCGTDQTAAAVNCIMLPLWSWVAQIGTVTTTTSCTTTTNVGSVANRGHQVFVDMDRYTHARLVYFGGMSGVQTGTVTVALRDIGAGTDAITTSWNSNTACIDRSSTVTDLTAKTGIVQWTARLGDSTAGDDPILSSISVEFCTGSF